MEKLSVLLINHEYPPIGGGGAYYTKYLAEELSYRGHNVYLVTVGTANESPVVKINNSLIKINIPLKRKSDKEIRSIEAFLFVIRAAFFLEEFIDKNKIDVIHSQFSLISGLAVCLIKNQVKSHNIKFIVTCLGADIFEPTRFRCARFIFNLLNKWIFKKADCITAPSEDMKTRILKLNKKLNIKKIYLGIDVDIFKNVNKLFCRLKHKFNQNDFILITVCRLVKRKNLFVSLEIFKKISQRFGNVKLLIVGDGPQKDEINKFIISNNLAEKIFLKGQLKLADLIEYYSLSDLFYTNSFHESFGLVYLESMSCGCPVLSTYNGGANEIVQNGVNGYLLSSEEEFINKIIYFIQNRQDLEKLSFNCSEFVPQNFDYKFMVDKFISIYSKQSEK